MVVLSSFGLFRNEGKTLVSSANSRKESLFEELSLFDELMISFQQRSILAPVSFPWKKVTASTAFLEVWKL